MKHGHHLDQISAQKMTPIVNVAPLFDNNAEAWANVDRLIGEACERRVGLVVTGLPQLSQQYASLEKGFDIFDLPESVLYDIAKREMRHDSKLTMRGYMKHTGGFSYSEGFDLGTEKSLRGPEIDGIDMLLHTNAWPSQEPNLGWRKEMVELFQRMESLGTMVVRSIARYLGSDESAAANRYQKSNSTLRFLKYPENPDMATPLRGEKDATLMIDGREVPVVTIEHTDNGGLTFQWQDEPGLQLQTPEGEWLNVPNIRDGFSVHLGEALETQTSGRMRATPHRVYSTGNNRQSMAFFFDPNLYSSVKPFSTVPNEPRASDEDTYAASMINTLRETGRA